MSDGASAYETWVMTLRAWAKDPNTDLNKLPVLTADALPPAAYERLISHIMSAQQAVMATWQERLQRNVEAAKTETDYARALVDLRVILARRLHLARHPALPEQIRDSLSAGVERDIQTIQEDLERTVADPGRGRLTVARERLLRLVRMNSFTAILQPGFPLDSLLRSGRSDDRGATLPESSPRSITTLGPTKPRRVVVDDGH